MTQLSLDDAVARPNPNAHLFDREGKPRRLMWCSDRVRIALSKGEPVECRYVGEQARYRPDGGCCLDLVGLSQEEIDERVIADRHASATPT